jgi:hypothetical protein
MAARVCLDLGEADGDVTADDHCAEQVARDLEDRTFVERPGQDWTELGQLWSGW